MAVQVKVSANGEVVIPADVSEQFGLRGGDDLLLDQTEHGLVLRTREQGIRLAQELVRKMMEGKPNRTVDDFIAERRREAAREAEEY